MIKLYKKKHSNITNPVFKTLEKLKLINKNNLIILSKKTRDKKIKVFQDVKSKIIFLEKYITKQDYYSKLKYKIDNKKINFKTNYSLKINKKKIKLKMLDDNYRRYLQFKNKLKKKKILDFGCGYGGFLSYIKNAKLLAGCDISKDCLLHIKKNYSKKIQVYNNIKNIQNNFDIITMFHVMEHLPNPIETLKDLKTKLSKTGKLIIEVPHANDFLLNLNNLKEFKTFTFWSEHLMLYTENSLKKIIKFAGFGNIKIYYFQRYDFNNHLGWFVNKKPNGNIFFKNIYEKNLNNCYIKFLKKIKQTDTLIAIADNKNK
jgi:2-polyprenyl-3-methyl-5-hydroxy-6-metoxy-1,4-benzoquinol methylase